VKWVDRKGCSPAGGQWDTQYGQAAAGSVKDCDVGAELPSAWLGLPAIGGVAISKN